jgi:hypothetical protein
MTNLNKTFTIAGTARNKDGSLKVRFANDMVSRLKILFAHGCTDVNLIELPSPMNKIEAMRHLKLTSVYDDPDAQYHIDTRLEETIRHSRSIATRSLMSTGTVGMPSYGINTEENINKVVEPA